MVLGLGIWGQRLNKRIDLAIYKIDLYDYIYTSLDSCHEGENEQRLAPVLNGPTAPGRTESENTLGLLLE